MIIEILLTLVVGPVLELVHPRVKVGRLVDLASRFDENNNKKVFYIFLSQCHTFDGSRLCSGTLNYELHQDLRSETIKVIASTFPPYIMV